MKQRFTFKTILLAGVALLTAGTTFSQTTTPFNATWALTTDPTAVVSGNISAAEQNVGPLIMGFQYNSSYGTAANNNVTTGWQRVGTTSSIRSTSDSALQGSYVEYRVTPTAGMHLQVRSVSIEALGGGTGTARLAAYYSTNNFTTMDSFPVPTNYNGAASRATIKDSVVLLNGGSGVPVLTGQQVVAFNDMAINVLPGQTFAVRFYVWLTSYSATARHFGDRNAVISGVTSTSALPVSFANAKAFQRSNGVQVEWTSATELNVSRYVIEKSTNGNTFTEVGSVAATGNGTISKSYSWYDATPSQGNNYYRIVAIDKDGATEYTGTLRVAIGRGAANVVVSPNPVRGNMLNLQLSNLDKGTYNVQLLNSAGQKVFASQVVHQGGSASEAMQIPGLQKGLYSLQLVSGTTRITKSVVVE